MLSWLLPGIEVDLRLYYRVKAKLKCDIHGLFVGENFPHREPGRIPRRQEAGDAGQNRHHQQPGDDTPRCKGIGQGRLKEHHADGVA